MINWKEITNFPNYMISTTGKVRSKERYRKGKTKDSLVLVKGRILKQETTKDGYNRVNLSKDGKHKHFSVHRLVANHFIENQENKPQVNHINGIKTDNRVENLEFVTAQENMQHAYDNGLVSPPDNGKSKSVILFRDNIVKTFNSASEASLYLSTNRCLVSQYLRTNHKTKSLPDGWDAKYVELD